MSQPVFWFALSALLIPMGEVQRLGESLSAVKIVVALSLVVGLAACAVTGRRLRRSPVQVPLLCLTAAFLPSFLMARAEGLLVVFLSFLGYVLLNLMLINFADNPKALRTITMAFVVGVVAVSVLGIAQFWTGSTFLEATGREELYTWTKENPEKVAYSRVLGTTQNPSAFAVNFVAAIPIILSLYFASRRRLAQLGLILALGLSLLTLILTFSRGSLVATAVACALVGVLGIRGFRQLRRATALALLVAAGFVLFLPEEATDYLLPFGHLSKDRSAEERLLVLEPALEIFKDNPIFGIGFLESKRMLQKYSDKVTWNMTIHNDLLALAVELGLVGLIPFVIITIVTLRLGLKAAARCRDAELRPLLIGVLAAYLGILVVGISHMEYNNIPLWFFLSLTNAASIQALGTARR